MAIAKAKIISELGERSLLLPELVADALAANARIKFALGWLQAAEAVADGRSATFNLEAERALAGLSGDPLYDPPGAVVRRGNAVFIPGASRVFSHMMDDLANMQTAVKLGATAANLSSSQLAQFSRRGEALSGRVTVQGDLVPVGLISSFAAPAQPGRDTFHSLVMDLHKALNSVAVAIAEEEIDGARVFRLGDSDRDRVKAFMRGLNRTAPLKFDHPGLATTSTRDGARLIIQNDVGITSSHVLMAYVEELKISVVYSDIHARRIDFLRRRLDGFKWTVANHPSPEAGGEMLYLATGVLDAPDVRHLDQMLEHLGATIVFLIDWNKARKCLRQIVSNNAAIDLLDWAAEHEVGHRGFLEAGGNALIADLLGSVSKTAGSSYSSLRSAVGDAGAIDFLRLAMRVCSEALQAGRSIQSVRELLRLELLARLASVSDRILDLALDHAALVLDLGNLVRRALFDAQPQIPAYARRGGEWESKADHIVVGIRDLAGAGKERVWCDIASAADDTADAFEDALFHLRFLPDDISQELRSALNRLAEDAIGGVKEYVRLLLAARHIHRGAPLGDLQAFFDLLERQHDREHATDGAERDVFAILMADSPQAKTLIVTTAIAGALEKSGDALLRTSRLVADHALGGWVAG